MKCLVKRLGMSGYLSFYRETWGISVYCEQKVLTESQYTNKNIRPNLIKVWGV